MNLTIRATYPATDGSAPESIEVEIEDINVGLLPLSGVIVPVIAAFANVASPRVYETVANGRGEPR